MPKGIYPRTEKIRRSLSKAKMGQIPWDKGLHFTDAHKAKLRENHKGMSGKHHSILTKEKISKGNKGTVFTKEWLKNLSTSHLGQKSYWKGKKRPELSGEKHPQWKGGITPINHLIRKSLEYKLWREAVFKRDNYTCVFCGQKGGNLEADHIKPFADYPELRFAIDNGRTLCKKCHHKTETFGFNYWVNERDKRC